MGTLTTTLAQINKKFGAGAIIQGSAMPSIRKILTGYPAFDYVTDGGVPIHRTTEFYGPFSSLKSYFLYVLIGKFQHYDWGNNVQDAFASITWKKVMGKKKKPKEGEEEQEPEYELVLDKVQMRRGYKPENAPVVKRVALIDYEGTYDPSWGEKLGVDNDALIYICPSSLEESIDMIDALMSDPEVCLVAVDSMIAMGSDMEVDASMTDNQMAANARFWNKACRKMKAAMNRNPEKDITLVAINGYYDKVGIAYGNPEVLKNGSQFKLMKDLSVRMEALKEMKVDEMVVGRNIKLACKKNKVGRPLMESSLYFSFVDDDYFAAGETDVTQQLIDLGINKEFIERKGTWYIYGEHKAAGMEKFKALLNEDKKVWQELKEAVYGTFRKA